MNLWKKLLEFILSKEQRKAARLPAPELAAFFWTGGAPIQHGIRDISSTGLYLLTDERWYLGTVIVITLQRSDEAEGSPERSVAVQSKAVRWGEDGVGLEFVLPETKGGKRNHNNLEMGADRKTLDKFLAGLSANNGYATVHGAVPPANPVTETSPDGTSSADAVGKKENLDAKM